MASNKHVWAIIRRSWWGLSKSSAWNVVLVNRKPAVFRLRQEAEQAKKGISAGGRLGGYHIVKVPTSVQEVANG